MTELAATPAAASRCAACGTELAPALLACPGCRALVHRGRLEALATEARDAEAVGDTGAALARWREMAALLPEGARQREVLLARVGAAEARAREASSGTAAPAPGAGAGTPWGRIGALAAAAAVFLLGKGKLLLLGLTKLKTVVSMLAFAGVYWSAFGWQWALGLALGIYVHEIGHVAALARYGVAANAPMFVPFVGAFVSWSGRLPGAGAEARVALAGPVWGLGFALAAQGLALATGADALHAIAATAALINLFNLAPVWILDGAKVFGALSAGERHVAAAGVALVALAARGPLAGLVFGTLLVVAGRMLPPAPAAGDRRVLAGYLLSAAALAWLATTAGPGATR